MTYRVVYVDHVARLSGGEIALVRALSALGDRVEASVILGEDGPLVERLEAVGAAVEVIPLGAPARDARKEGVRLGGLEFAALRASGQYVGRLARRLRQLQPDLVHTNSLKAALYGGAAGRLAGIPVVWHIRDRIAADYLPSSAVRLVRLAGRLLPSAIIANSWTTLETLPGWRPGEVVTNSVVVPATVDIRRPSGRVPRPYRIGMVGRLAPWKGQDVFIDAFALAFPDGPTEAWLVGAAMFGEDSYERSLRRQAEHLGLGDRVVFRGFSDDVWAELAQLDVLVHCSRVPEPFGQVVVEGMAVGIPVIAAAAGGPAEIITNERNGLLVAPGDATSLSAAMRRVHEDASLRRLLVEQGLMTATRYSPERTANEVLAVYDRVLRHHRPRE